jgi:selenide,water dikinase
MGMADSGDVGIYRLSDDIAIVQSVDYFPPLVADAYRFGQIAAANALSDIYTTGAKPVTGLNLFAAPHGEDVNVLADILRGGHDKMTEAGAVIVGGHTLLDDNIKYGLAVTGVVHPDRIVRHDNPIAGDVLVLTKAIGTGSTVTARAQGVVSDEIMQAVIDQMCTLNRAASEAMVGLGAHAATDVTGFGLIGHAFLMLPRGKVGYRIYYDKVPLLTGVEDFAAAGYYPAGTKNNLKHFREHVDYGNASKQQRIILNDAQTSGGLLISLPADSAEKIVEMLGGSAAVIGDVVEQHPGRIEVVP